MATPGAPGAGIRPPEGIGYVAAMAEISPIALAMLPDRTHADLTMEAEARERRTGRRMEPTPVERPVARS